MTQACDGCIMEKEDKNIFQNCASKGENMDNSIPSPLKHSLFHIISQQWAKDLPIVRCTKNTLVHLSHILEDTILKNQIPAMLFTGFQETSHWKEETERYHQLADVAQQVCIFAGKPLPSENHAKQFHIELAEDDSLRQEWFLLILSDDFSVLLCGQDTQHDVEDDVEREFDTIWTFDIRHISHTVDILENVIEHYRPERLAELQQVRKKYQLHSPSASILSRFVMDILVYETSLNKALREQATWLEAVMHNIGQYAYVIEIEPQVKSTFRPVFGDFQKLFGYPIQSGDDAFYWFDILVHPDDKPRFYENQKKQIADAFLDHEYRYVHKDGHTLWLRVTSRTTLNPDGKTTRYGVFQDVTLMREAERIQRENKRLELALEQEKEINATRTYFMNSVMHEFRNPLATVLLASEMLERYKEKMTEEEKDKRLQTIQQQIIQLRNTLDDMALILNNKLSEMGFYPNPEDATAYFGEVVAHFRAGKASQRHVEFESTLPSALVLLDRRLLKYATSAILSNAIQYSLAGTPIRLGLKQQDEWLIFSVVDEGIGIPQAEISHAFEPLFRASNVPPKQHGGGLGLTIAKECIELHGGKIQLTSEEGSGTTVSICLPYQIA